MSANIDAVVEKVLGEQSSREGLLLGNYLVCLREGLWEEDNDIEEAVEDALLMEFPGRGGPWWLGEESWLAIEQGGANLDVWLESRDRARVGNRV